MKLLFFLLLLTGALAGNVVVFIPLPIKSANILFKSISSLLAGKGHQVTVITALKSSKLEPGIEEIVISSINDVFKPLLSSDAMLKDKSFFEEFDLNKKIGFDMPFIIFNHTYVNKDYQKLLQSNKKIDLIIVPPLCHEGGLLLSHNLKAPFVMLSPAGFIPFSAENMRISPGLSNAPITLLPFTNNMTFLQRLVNFFLHAVLTGMRQLILGPLMDSHIQDISGKQYPSILDIEQNVSLYLLNQHWSVDYPRTFPPHVIEVGALHCKPAKPVEQNLDKWLTASGDAGFIFFSMGSIIQGRTMSEERRQMFIRVFSRLPQKVLWKWESSHMEGLPPNVKVEKWLPQPDILAHPKIKAFLSHGGTLSTLESMYHGTPMVTLPVIVDHFINGRKTEAVGAGINLDWKTVTEEQLENALKQVINDPKFKDNTAARSKVMQDLPMPAADTAVFWLEYVMRHEGAPHLRPGALSISWIAYQMIDIFIFLLAILILTIAFNVWLIKKLYRRCCKSKKQKSE